jgi:hypothetical protein
MPQGPIAVQNVLNPKAKSVLNVTTATVIKNGAGTLLGLTVVVAGSATGTVNDVNSNAPTASNEMLVIPESVGPIPVPGAGWPFVNGLLIVPGTGQTIAVVYQ